MTNENTLPRMRTAKAALEELKERDPNTAFTERAIRRLILTGELPSVRIGRKYLINMDCLYSFLYEGTPHHEAATAAGIRVVAE